jgi:ubiquinone/menaquinone biosynthesis C-methylase UbiE
MTDATRIKEFYRRQAGLYDATRWITLRGRRAAVRALDIGAQHDVLEIGCGTGLNFPMLAEIVDPRRAIVGIDFSPDMLVVARRRIRAGGWNNVEVIEADACRLALGRRFDRVLFVYSASMMPAWQEALARAGEHLAPEGRITVLDFGDFSGWSLFAPMMRRWLSVNHTNAGQPYPSVLRSLVGTVTIKRGLAGYYVITSADQGR